MDGSIDRPPAADVYSMIYQALDGAAVYDGGFVPPGTQGALFAGIDRLRITGADDPAVARAEQANLIVHRLQGALQCGQATEAAALRLRLHVMADDWIESAPVRSRC